MSGSDQRVGPSRVSDVININIMHFQTRSSHVVLGHLHIQMQMEAELSKKVQVTIGLQGGVIFSSLFYRVSGISYQRKRRRSSSKHSRRR